MRNPSTTKVLHTEQLFPAPIQGRQTWAYCGEQGLLQVVSAQREHEILQGICGIRGGFLQCPSGHTVFSDSLGPGPTGTDGPTPILPRDFACWGPQPKTATPRLRFKPGLDLWWKKKFRLVRC